MIVLVDIIKIQIVIVFNVQVSVLHAMQVVILLVNLVLVEHIWMEQLVENVQIFVLDAHLLLKCNAVLVLLDIMLIIINVQDVLSSVWNVKHQQITVQNVILVFGGIHH